MKQIGRVTVCVREALWRIFPVNSTIYLILTIHLIMFILSLLNNVGEISLD